MFEETQVKVGIKYYNFSEKRKCLFILLTKKTEVVSLSMSFFSKELINKQKAPCMFRQNTVKPKLQSVFLAVVVVVVYFI